MEPQRLRFTTSSDPRSNLDRAIAILAQHIATHRYWIAQLARQGRDTRRAESVLQDLERRIAFHVIERDR